MYNSILLDKYLTKHTSPEPSYLKELERETYIKALNPRMLSGHIQGRFLSLLSKLVKPQRILEIGTFTGYSALCLAEGLAEEGLLQTIDINDEVKDIAQKYINIGGFNNKIELITGNALEVTTMLDKKYDLVFIDGEKREYPDYLKLVKPLLNKNGFLIVDNVLWNGKVLDEIDSNDIATIAVDTFNNILSGDNTFEIIMLPLRDGLTIAKKII